MPCAAAAIAMLLETSANAATSREWRFDVSLDGKPIGEHRYSLRSHDDRRELTSEARFDVKVLFLSAYRYEHEAREVWQGDCLQQIEARTNDDGEHSTIVGRQTDDQFRVDSDGSTEIIDRCVQSFAYWNPRILDAAQLLNPQTGEYVPVTIVPMGRESIGKHDTAERYRLTGKDKRGTPMQIDLWYSPQQEWLALESLMPNGRRLLYSLK